MFQYGLYSAFMGCFIYVLFGTSKDITLGPTAILSLLTASITDSCDYDLERPELRIPCAVALTFFSGAIQLAIGLLNLGGWGSLKIGRGCAWQFEECKTCELLVHDLLVSI